MKIDFHVHIKRGHNLAAVREVLRYRRLDAIAVTNFGNISFTRWLQRKLPDVMVIIGKEIESNAGHILGIGLQENIHDRLSPAETIAQIHDQGGLAVLAHPFLLFNSVPTVGEYANLPFDAVEIFNHRAEPLIWPNALARLRYRGSKLPLLANSDAKNIVNIGAAYNIVPGSSQAEVLNAVRSSQIRHVTTRQWPTPAWLYNFGHSYLTRHRSQNCGLCGSLYRRTLRKHSYRCIVCERTSERRVVCPTGHYLCSRCQEHRDGMPEAITAFRENAGIAA